MIPAAGNPLVAIGLVILALIVVVFLFFAALCALALFLPVILVVAGLFVLLVGRGLPMNMRLLVGFALILIGVGWLLLAW